MSSSDRGFPRFFALLVLYALGAACARGPGSEHDPSPQRMVPVWGMNTEPVFAFIEGENFLALATQHIGGREPVTVDARFEAFLGEVALEDVTWVDARTLRARVPGGLATGWHSLTVVGPLGRSVELPRAYFSSDRPLARLEAQAVLAQGQVSVEERTRLVLTVRNTGGSAALAVTPVLRSEGQGRVEVLSEPEPADIAGDGSASFTWELEAAAPGELRFTLEVRGLESMAGAELRAPDVEVGPLRIRNRTVLTASLTASPLVINVGQEVKISLRVTNTGETAALGVGPGGPVVLGPPVIRVSGPEPASADIPAGESRDFEWTYVSALGGTLVFQVGAEGRDAFSGTRVRALEARSANITVQLQGVMMARFSSLPASVDVGQEFDVELEVTNRSDSAVLGVKLDATGASSTCRVALVSGPEPKSVDIPGKGRAVFHARLVGVGEGSCVFRAGARGVHQTDGTPVVVKPVGSSVVKVLRPRD